MARPDRLRTLRPAHRARFHGDVMPAADAHEIAALASVAPPIGGGLTVAEIERDIARLAAELPADDPELVAANELVIKAEREARLWKAVGEILAKGQSG